MADKNVNLVGTKVQAATIADFYTRLNALRELNEEQTISPVSFTAPVVGTRVNATDIHDAAQAVLDTKSALTFLATVDISTYEPTNVSAGDLIEAVNTAHPIEWQIGQLENACHQYFSINRVANKTTNYSNFNVPAVNTCGSFCPSNKSPNHTANYATQYTANFTTNFTAQRYANHAPNYTNAQGYHYNGFFTAFGAYFDNYHRWNYVRHFSGQCTVYGTHFRFHYPGNYAPNVHSICGPNVISQNQPNYANNCTANRGTNFTAQRATNRAPNYATQCTSQCSTVFTSYNAANFSSNNSNDNAADFTAFTAVFAANHGVFTVEPLPSSAI